MATKKKTTEPAESAESELSKPERKHAPHTRPNGSENRKVHTNPGDNARYMQHSLRLVELPKIDKKDPEAVRKRIMEYFEIVMEDDMKPSVASLALATGIDRRRFREAYNDPSSPIHEIAVTAYQILDAQMNDYMQNGKINPVSGIFLMKNNFGYTDQQEVVLTPKDPLGAQKDLKELEQKYIETAAVDLPDDE